MSVKQDLEAGEYYANLQRKIMGAKKYAEWLESQQLNQYTNFKSFNEVKKILEKAGYDFSTINTSKYLYQKTHINKNEDDCIYWVMRHNKVTAVMYDGVNKNDFRKFILAVEKASGKRCFFDSVADVNNEPQIEKLPEQIFITNFSDKNILKQAMLNIGLKISENSNKLSTVIHNCPVTLQDGENTNFEFKITGNIDLKIIYPYFQKIEFEYQKIIQNNICNSIKDKVIKSGNMRIENEEILDDNSVLLTINI